ncbi:MAG: CHAT domain-containing protein [Chitinophagales bacterium]
MTNLKIIPAGILNTIPFEALLTEKVATNTKYADLPYLLLQYDISYHYSATLWYQALQNRDKKQMEAHSTLEEVSFVGFAPVYKNEEDELQASPITINLYNEESTRSVRIGAETYSELIHSEEEVNSVQSYFNAKNIPTQTYLHTEANTSNFLQNIGKHKYVLISAHGFYNEKQPDLTGIILSPDVAKNPEQSGQASPSSEFPLWRGQGEVNGDVRSGQVSPNFTSVGEPSSIFYLSDAYNLELNADLVVLSCCETGVGKLAKGEGVMALNRGFFYAGAKNVIYTLFKVYDKASCQLTQHLFQHILEQKGYALSLNEAKRQMILEGKAPIQWAGYLLIGE